MTTGSLCRVEKVQENIYIGWMLFFRKHYFDANSRNVGLNKNLDINQFEYCQMLKSTQAVDAKPVFNCSILV